MPDGSGAILFVLKALESLKRHPQRLFLEFLDLGKQLRGGPIYILIGVGLTEIPESPVCILQMGSVASHYIGLYLRSSFTSKPTKSSANSLRT